MGTLNTKHVPLLIVTVLLVCFAAPFVLICGLITLIQGLFLHLPPVEDNEQV